MQRRIRKLNMQSVQVIHACQHILPFHMEQKEHSAIYQPQPVHRRMERDKPEKVMKTTLIKRKGCHVPEYADSLHHHPAFGTETKLPEKKDDFLQHQKQPGARKEQQTARYAESKCINQHFPYRQRLYTGIGCH